VWYRNYYMVNLERYNSLSLKQICPSQLSIDSTEQLAEISFYDKGKKVLSRKRCL